MHKLQLSDQNTDIVVSSKRGPINYDNIVSESNFFYKHLQLLKSGVLNSENSFNSIDESIFESLENEFHIKQDVLDEFKSKHALLINSISFLVETHRDKELMGELHDSSITSERFNELISIIALNGNWSELYGSDIQAILKTFEQELKRNRDRKYLPYIYIHTKKLVEVARDIDIALGRIQERRVFHELVILKSILMDKFSQDRKLQDNIFYSLVGSSAIFFLFLMFFLERERQLERELKALNQDLNRRIDEAVKDNRKKDKLMFQQSKLASMGEMIGNIAHQWRQPLNSISIIIQDYESAYEFDELDGEYLQKSRNDAMKLIDYMSKTIDDFREFFRESTSKEVFGIRDVVGDSVKIVETSLRANSIALDIELHTDGSINGVKSRFMQVVINILKNAQDVLIEKDVESPKIEIKSFIENRRYTLSIKDNAGGIPDEIKDKIFEPYFTTKHQSVGTGIGLYMSKLIIETTFGGFLKVSNVDDGAEFKIEIPIS
jgi:signal transduction histidine kinase